MKKASEAAEEVLIKTILSMSSVERQLLFVFVAALSFQITTLSVEFGTITVCNSFVLDQFHRIPFRAGFDRHGLVCPACQILLQIG